MFFAMFLFRRSQVTSATEVTSTRINAGINAYKTAYPSSALSFTLLHNIPGDDTSLPPTINTEVQETHLVLL